MPIIRLDRAEFWEFKARTAALDLEAAQLRLKLHAVTQQRNALVDAFARRHGLDASKPITLEDSDYTASQDLVTEDL